MKLNSANFQRGSFDADDAHAVVAMLNERAVNCVALSGGNYKSPAMHGTTTDAHTLAREAFFLESAVEMLAAARVPLMVTGSIWRRKTAERVIASGVGLAGVGTALALEPDLPAHWREAKRCIAPPELRRESKALRSLARMNYVAARSNNLALVRRRAHDITVGTDTGRYADCDFHVNIRHGDEISKTRFSRIRLDYSHSVDASQCFKYFEYFRRSQT